MKSSERLLLCAPKRGKIDASGKVDDGQLGRLATFNNRLDSSGCQKSKAASALAHIEPRPHPASRSRQPTGRGLRSSLVLRRAIKEDAFIGDEYVVEDHKAFRHMDL